jgi:hypothetical protein
MAEPIRRPAPARRRLSEQVPDSSNRAAAARADHLCHSAAATQPTPRASRAAATAASPDGAEAPHRGPAAGRRDLGFSRRSLRVPGSIERPRIRVMISGGRQMRVQRTSTKPAEPRAARSAHAARCRSDSRHCSESLHGRGGAVHRGMTRRPAAAAAVLDVVARSCRRGARLMSSKPDGLKASGPGPDKPSVGLKDFRPRPDTGGGPLERSAGTFGALPVPGPRRPKAAAL